MLLRTIFPSILLLMLTAPVVAQPGVAGAVSPTIQDQAGVFRLDLPDDTFRHGLLDFKASGMRARGVWVDVPTGIDERGARKSFRLRWFWLAEKDVLSRFGKAAGSPLACIKRDLESVLTKRHEPKTSRRSWAQGIGLPSIHDPARFRSPGSGSWRNERVGKTVWEQFRGAQKADPASPKTAPLLGYVGVHREGGRIFVNALWWDESVLVQKVADLARYGELAERTARSFRLVKRTD